MTQYKIWEFKQSANEGEIDLYIYGTIKGDSRDWWTGQIEKSETSAQFFREELAKHKDVTQINLYVNSYGGYVYEAMSIRNQLKRHSAKVVGYVDGFAASAASFILTACDVVKMYSNTMQMIHNMLDGVFGNARQLRAAADNLDRIMIGNRRAYIEKSGGKLNEEELKEMLDSDTWLTAQMCYEYGLCDEVIEDEADLTEAKSMLEQHNKGLEQQLEYCQKMQALIQGFESEYQQQEPPKNPDDKAQTLETEIATTTQLMAAIMAVGNGVAE